MTQQGLIENIKFYKQQGDWRYALIRWLALNATSISPQSVDQIYHYISGVKPTITREETQEQMETLKASGLVEEKQKELGGRYWWIPDEWCSKLRDVLEIPAVPPPEVKPPIITPTPVYEKEFGSGPIGDLFKGIGLEMLTVKVLGKTGYAHVEGPRVPYKRIHFDAWALEPQGTLLLVECKGWDESVGIAEVREFSDRVRDVREEEPTRSIEAWFVTTGDLSPEAKSLCQDRCFKIVGGLELLKQAVGYGILGIGMKENQPYVTRRGEQGIFLNAKELEAKFGDPALALEIIS